MIVFTVSPKLWSGLYFANILRIIVSSCRHEERSELCKDDILRRCLEGLLCEFVNLLLSAKRSRSSESMIVLFCETRIKGYLRRH